MVIIINETDFNTEMWIYWKILWIHQFNYQEPLSVNIENPARQVYFTKKKPFGKLFSKTIFKSSSEAPFLRKIGKFKISLNLVGPKEIMQITEFLKARAKKRKLILVHL